MAKCISVKKVTDATGSISLLARKLGLTRQAVQQWKKVPAIYVLNIEDITGISRHKIRPDVFGKAPKSPKINIA